MLYLSHLSQDLKSEARHIETWTAEQILVEGRKNKTAWKTDTNVTLRRCRCFSDSKPADSSPSSPAHDHYKRIRVISACGACFARALIISRLYTALRAHEGFDLTNTNLLATSSVEMVMIGSLEKDTHCTLALHTRHRQFPCRDHMIPGRCAHAQIASEPRTGRKHK